MPEPYEWNTFEEAVEGLKEHRDDFQKVIFRLADATWQIGQNKFNGAYMEIEHCDGTSSMVRWDVAQKLLDQGVIQGLRLPMKLVPVRLSRRGAV